MAIQATNHGERPVNFSRKASNVGYGKLDPGTAMFVRDGELVVFVDTDENTDRVDGLKMGGLLNGLAIVDIGIAIGAIVGMSYIGGELIKVPKELS